MSQTERSHGHREKKRYITIDPKSIMMPSDLSQGQIAEVRLTNLTQETVAFRCRMRDPSKCSVRPSKGTIPPTGQQNVRIHVLPIVGTDRIDKIVVDSITLIDSSETDDVWKTRSSSAVKQAIAFKYPDSTEIDEAPSECPSGFTSAVQTPAVSQFKPSLATVEPVVVPSVESRLESEQQNSSSALDESELLKSCVSVLPEDLPKGVFVPHAAYLVPDSDREKNQICVICTPKTLATLKEKLGAIENVLICGENDDSFHVKARPGCLNAVFEQAVQICREIDSDFTELQEKYNRLLAERNELQSRSTALQGQIALLQANADSKQKKADVKQEDQGAEKSSWRVFVAAAFILLSVIIYSIARSIPSDKTEL